MEKFDFKSWWTNFISNTKSFFINFKTKIEKWWKEDLTPNQKKAILALIALLICLIIILITHSCSTTKHRNNTLAIVEMYTDKGEYDRALDKLEELLQKDPTDKELIALMDKIIEEKNKNAQNPGYGGFDGNVNVSVDTNGLQSSIDAMKSEFAQALRDQSAKQNAESEKARKEMEALMKLQQENAALEQARIEQNLKNQKLQEEQRQREEAARKAAEEKKAKEEAARKAAEEKKAKEDAEKAAQKKAQEEALAKKNAALQKEINAVNEEIAQGKSCLGIGKYDGANGAYDHFMKAIAKMPVSEGEPAFSASKYSEMAAALYDTAQNVSSDDDKRKLMNTAVTYAEECLKKNPKDAVSQYILGMNAYDKKEWPKAAEYLEKAIASDGKNYLYYYNLGRVQYMMKKYSEAKQSFNTSCSLNGSFAPARYNLGLTNLKLTDSKSALSDFRKAHDIDTRYERAYLEEARLLSRLGDYSGAVTAYLNVIRINNTNRAALQELGSAYYQQKKYPEAESSFRQSLALLPVGTEDPLTNFNLSTVLYEQKKTQDAITYAKKAYDSYNLLRDNTSKANIIYNYALLLDKAGNEAEAIAKYSEVLRVKSDHLKTLTNLGVMYMNTTPQDADMALSLFQRAYALDKNNFEVNNNLGSAYLAKKDYKNAITYFQVAVKMDPKSNDARYNLGQAFASDGQFDNAKTTYIELVKQQPSNWDAYVELGKVCLTLQDNENAEKYLLFVQSKNPSYRKSEVDTLLSSIHN